VLIDGYPAFYRQPDKPAGHLEPPRCDSRERTGGNRSDRINGLRPIIAKATSSPVARCPWRWFRRNALQHELPVVGVGVERGDERGAWVTTTAATASILARSGAPARQQGRVQAGSGSLRIISAGGRANSRPRRAAPGLAAAAGAPDRASIEAVAGRGGYPCPALVAALDANADYRQIVLEKHFGETIAKGQRATELDVAFAIIGRRPLMRSLRFRACVPDYRIVAVRGDPRFIWLPVKRRVSSISTTRDCPSAGSPVGGLPARSNAPLSRRGLRAAPSRSRPRTSSRRPRGASNGIRAAFQGGKVEPFMRGDEIDYAGTSAGPVQAALEQHVGDRTCLHRIAVS